MDTLVTLAKQDQAIRMLVAKSKGKDTTLLMKMSSYDSSTTSVLRELLAGRAWFEREELDRKQLKAAFTLLQHTYDLNMQEGALPHLSWLADSGLIARADYVTLLDRTLVFRDKPQLYGTQLHEVDGKFVAYPIADTMKVEALRKEVGLPSLEWYLKMANQMFKSQ